jgi:hypothetical protein
LWKKFQTEGGIKMISKMKRKVSLILVCAMLLLLLPGAALAERAEHGYTHGYLLVNHICGHCGSSDTGVGVGKEIFDVHGNSVYAEFIVYRFFRLPPGEFFISHYYTRVSGLGSVFAGSLVMTSRPGELRVYNRYITSQGGMLFCCHPYYPYY